MKREIPLFLLDTKKQHKKGECDFIACTDIDSGFVARLDYIQEQQPEYGDNYRIDFANNGLSLKLSIIRITGKHPDTGNIRTLMKKGMEYYVKSVRLNVDASNITTDQCIDFIVKLCDGNRHALQDTRIDYNERRVVLTSLAMLDDIKNKLFKLKLIEEDSI